MSIQHTITRAWKVAGQTISKDEVLVADGETNRDVNCAGAGHTTVIDYNIRTAELRSFYLTCDKAVTVTPFDTSNNPMSAISLTANIPYVWTAGSGLTNPFASDISAMHVLNGNSASALFQLRSLVDSTPANPVGS